MVNLIDMIHTLYIWIIDMKKVAYMVAVIGKITHTRS